MARGFRRDSPGNIVTKVQSPRGNKSPLVVRDSVSRAKAEKRASNPLRLGQGNQPVGVSERERCSKRCSERAAKVAARCSQMRRRGLVARPDRKRVVGGNWTSQVRSSPHVERGCCNCPNWPARDERVKIWFVRVSLFPSIPSFS